jgi:hypothetical protein
MLFVACFFSTKTIVDQNRRNCVTCALRVGGPAVQTVQHSTTRPSSLRSFVLQFDTVMAPHKLQNSWVIWEIKEKQGNADVRKVNTWECFLDLPLTT